MKKWEKFSKEDIEQFVKDSKSYAELARKIGYDDASKNGSAYRNVHQMIDKLDLDTSHFTGQGWNKDNFDYSRFRYGKKIKTADALNAITLLRGHKCENCGLEEWRGKKIPLEVHHIDGDELNSNLSNLQILCPNCHALTDNYKGKNINSGLMIVSDEDLVKALNKYPNIRQALMSVGLTGKGGNYVRANELIQKYQIKKYLY
jgi:hypothetical protein